SESHANCERLSIGIFGCFRLACLLICNTGLMPEPGDGAWFVQLREPLAPFFVCLQRLLVAVLLCADYPKVAFSDGDIPFGTPFLVTTECLFVSGSGFVQPT